MSENLSKKSTPAQYEKAIKNQTPYLTREGLVFARRSAKLAPPTEAELKRAGTALPLQHQPLKKSVEPMNHGGFTLGKS